MVAIADYASRFERAVTEVFGKPANKHIHEYAAEIIVPFEDALFTFWIHPGQSEIEMNVTIKSDLSNLTFTYGDVCCAVGAPVNFFMFREETFNDVAAEMLNRAKKLQLAYVADPAGMIIKLSQCKSGASA